MSFNVIFHRIEAIHGGGLESYEQSSYPAHKNDSRVCLTSLKSINSIVLESLCCAEIDIQPIPVTRWKKHACISIFLHCWLSASQLYIWSDQQKLSKWTLFSFPLQHSIFQLNFSLFINSKQYREKRVDKFIWIFNGKWKTIYLSEKSPATPWKGGRTQSLKKSI